MPRDSNRPLCTRGEREPDTSDPTIPNSASIDRERRIRPVSTQHAINGALCRLQFLQRALLESGCEARGEKQLVLIAKRKIQVLGKSHDHFTAGLRLSGLKTRQMPGRALRCVCEVGLRHAPPLAPTPKQDAERKLIGTHRANLASDPAVLNDLRGQVGCAEPLFFDPWGHRFRLTFKRMLTRGFGSNLRPAKLRGGTCPGLITTCSHF